MATKCNDWTHFFLPRIGKKKYLQTTFWGQLEKSEYELYVRCYIKIKFLFIYNSVVDRSRVSQLCHY